MNTNKIESFDVSKIFDGENSRVLLKTHKNNLNIYLARCEASNTLFQAADSAFDCIYVSYNNCNTSPSKIFFLNESYSKDIFNQNYKERCKCPFPYKLQVTIDLVNKYVISILSNPSL